MKELLKSLAGLQAELKPITKNQENPFFKSKYADLVAVVGYLQPLLTKHGLGFTQIVSTLEDGNTALTTRIFHAESGESIEGTMPLLLVKNDPQAQGSAITYARRYALCSMLGVVTEDEDDDGNAASTQTEATATSTVAKKPYLSDKPLTGEATPKQIEMIKKIAKQKGVQIQTDGISKKEASETIDRLLKTKTLNTDLPEDAPIGQEDIDISEIPF